MPNRIASRRPATTFFVLAFVITWAVWLPRALGFDWAMSVGTVWTYGPAIAAVLAALLVGGRDELRRLHRRLDQWRIGAGWYAAIVLGPVALCLVEATLTTALFGGPWSARLPDVFDAPVPIWLLLIVILTVTDGLGEELGWRGFALPHLLQGRNATVVSVGLGLLWAVWHLPLFATETSALEGAYVWALVLRLPATAVVYTWLYRGTGGSIVAAALFHGCVNLFSVAPAGSGDAVGPVVVSIALHWVVAATLVALAGAADLDRWPRHRRRLDDGSRVDGFEPPDPPPPGPGERTGAGASARPRRAALGTRRR